MKIKPTNTKANPGNLRARCESGFLLLPDKVASAFAELGVRNAPELLSYLETFPSAVASKLGWEVTDVLHADKTLRKQLTGCVDDAILFPKAHPQPTFGAATPPGLDDEA